MQAISGKFVALIAGIGTLASVYAVAYPDVSPMVAEPQAHVVFVGDMLFDRYIRTTMENRGEDFIFSCLGGLLENADIVVGNLEGPITQFPSVSATSTVGDPYNMTFTFAPQTAKLLKRNGISAVNIGNNHILNFGWAGYESTLQYLNAAGLGYFGDVYGRTYVYAKEIQGVRIDLINYSEFGGSSRATIAGITAAREAGQMPIVYAHWGEEYAMATEMQKKLAHEFIDAGAELVVGSHPHVVQEHDVYQGKHIYYSLGNFIFDQYWDKSVRKGLLIDVTFTKNGVESVREIPVELQRDGRTCPAKL